MYLKYCTILILIFTVVFSAMAQNVNSIFTGGGEENFFVLEEEIASVASKYAQKLSETPAIISVLTKKQLNGLACRTLADALRFVPGIEVSIDELGGYEKIAIRGVRTWSNVLFMIDGHRLNDFYSGLALYDYPIEGIEKIEIIRGPGSSIHGTGGFVGVINVITNNNIEDGFICNFAGGENNTKNLSVNWSGKSNKWQSNLFFNIFKTNGQKHQLYGSHDSTRAKDDGRTGPHLPIDALQPRETNSDPEIITENIIRNNIANINSSITNTMFDLGKTKENKDKLLLDYKLYKDDTNYRFKFMSDKRGPNIGLRGFVAPNSELKRDIVTAYYDKTFNIQKYNTELIGKLYFDQQNVSDKDQIEPNEPIMGNTITEGKVQKLEYKAKTFGMEFQANHQTKKLTTVSGIQFERLGLNDYSFYTRADGATNQNLLKTSKPNLYRTVLGIFLQEEYRPNNYLGFTAGVRYDNYNDFGSTTNPKIGSVYMLGKHFQKEYLKNIILKLSYATSFRAPTFKELYDNTQTELIYGAIGNSDLNPEKIKTYEIALEYKYKILKMKFNYYKNTIKDKIGVTPGLLGTVTGVSNKYFNNPNEIKTKGFEFETNTTKITLHKFFPDMWFWYNLSIVKVDADPFFIGITEMKGVTRTELPQWEWTVGINSGISEFLRLGLSYEKISERNSNARTSIEYELKNRWKIPEQYELNMHLYTTDDFLENMKLGIKIFNFTDETNYDDPSTIGSQEIERESRNIIGYAEIKF